MSKKRRRKSGRRGLRKGDNRSRTGEKGGGGGGGEKVMDIATERNGGRKENDYRDHDPHHFRHQDHGRAKANKLDPSSLKHADKDDEVIDLHTTYRCS